MYIFYDFFGPEPFAGCMFILSMPSTMNAHCVVLYLMHKKIAITEVNFYFLMVLIAYCELLTGLHSICISNICISTLEFEGERTKSETVMPPGKQYFAMDWTLVICFFDMGSCVLIHKVTLKTIINSSLT